MPDVAVLVLGGGTNGLSWARSLGRRGVRVVVVDEDRTCPARFSRYASGYVGCRSPLEDAEGFVAGLLDASGRYPGAVVVPTGDRWVEVLSRYRERLREHFRVPVPPWSSTDVFIHKRKCLTRAMALGLAIPRTLMVSEEGVVEGDLKEMSYPCVVKPEAVHRFGQVFHTKMFRAESREEVKHYLELSRGLSVRMMVQEIVPGGPECLHEYVGYYDDASRPLAEFTWQKLRQCPPIFGVGRVGQSTSNAEVIEPARRILREIGFVGMCEVEFKLDARDGRYKFIEINGRSTLQLQLPIDCGMDFPWILYRDMTGSLEAGDIPTGYRRGLRWVDVLGEIQVMLRFGDRERLSLRERWGPYVGEVSRAVWDRQDARPFTAACMEYLRGGLRIVGRGLSSSRTGVSS